MTAAALMLQGCLAGLPRQESAPKAALLAEQIRLAEESEAAGDIPGAVFHWQAASALAPAEDRVAQNLRRLERRREAEAKRLRETGVRDLTGGRNRNARRKLLQALALDSTDRGTLEQLRGLERHRLDRQMLAKIARSREALDLQHAEAPRLRMNQGDGRHQEELDYLANELDAAPAPATPKKTEATELVDEHLRLADDHFKGHRFNAALKEIRQAEQAAGDDPGLAGRVLLRRREYADWLYGSGIRLASSDPQRARALLHQTLRFQPGHAKAAIRIRRLSPPRFE